MAPFFFPGSRSSGGTSSGGVRRFEQAVGASPAVLPAGTHTVYFHLRKGTAGTPREFSLPVLVSRFTAGNKDFMEAVHAPQGIEINNKSVNVRASYVAGTRTLTYAVNASGDTGSRTYLDGVTAVGEA